LAPIKKPKVTFSFPNVTLTTNTNVRMSETSTFNEYTFTPNGCGTTYSTEIKQLNSYNGLEIFKNFKLIEALYDWGDGGLVKVDKSGNGTTSSTHQFSKPGKYTISTLVKTGMTDIYEKKELEVTVKYNEPKPDFTWSSDYAFKGQEKVTLTNKTTNNPDGREDLYSYTWEIYDDADNPVRYTGKQFDFSPEYNFKTPGKKQIKLICQWNDGFEDKVVENVKELEIKTFTTPELDFSWDSLIEVKGNNPIDYHNLSVRDSDDKRSLEYMYDWIIYDSTLDGDESNFEVNSVDVDYEPSYVYKSPGKKQIKLICYWNDGFEDKVVEKVKEFTLEEFSITTDFIWDKICKDRAENVSFTNKTTGDVEKIQEYLWDVEDSYPASTKDFYVFKLNETSRFGEGSPDNSKEVINNKQFSTENIVTNFHSEKEKNIKLTVTYFTGWENKQNIKEKKYTPNHHTISSKLVASTTKPKGRKDVVEFSNEYVDTNDLLYYYDLIISDFYSKCNIDNTTGNIQDNSITYNKVNIDDFISHAFQNSESNDVQMKTYYDNGWGRAYITSSTKITPVLYKEPTVDFSWTPEVATSRNEGITFSGIYTDIDNSIINCTWTISDEFDLNNPNNPKYGIEITNNDTKYVDVNKEYSPVHQFQSNKDHNITLLVKYDDGFCEKQKEIIKTIITKDIVKVKPSFKLVYNDKEISEIIPLVGIKMVNTTESDDIVDIRWQLNDRSYYSDNDVIVNLSDDSPEYIWQNATRIPLCIGSSQEKFKTVKMILTYDNGWTDVSEVEVSRDYLASTNEVKDVVISYKNLDYDNATDVYGSERVHFWSTYKMTYPELVEYSEWTVENAEHLIEYVIESDEDFIYQFKSVGEKEVFLDLYFEDGYGNEYSVSKSIKLSVSELLEPDLDFVWEGSDIVVGSNVKFRSINSNSSRPYASISELRIDYYVDGEYDKFDIDGDGIDESDILEVNKVWWHIFDRSEKPTRIKLVGKWNNGFEDRFIEVIKELDIISMPPQCTLVVNHISNRKYQMIIEHEKSSGLEYKFEIYVKTPIVSTEPCRDMNDLESDLPICSYDTPFGSEYYMIYETDWIDTNETWVSIASSGKFKGIGYVRNDSGESSDEEYFEIEKVKENATVIQCSRQCITGIIKKYTYASTGETKW